jgi:hypothetical protein
MRWAGAAPLAAAAASDTADVDVVGAVDQVFSSRTPSPRTPAWPSISPRLPFLAGEAELAQYIHLYAAVAGGHRRQLPALVSTLRAVLDHLRLDDRPSTSATLGLGTFSGRFQLSNQLIQRLTVLAQALR